MRPAKVGNYTYFRSTRKDKKLMTQVNGKLVHFGQNGYKHYFDKTGLLPKEQNHLDEKRRQSYLSRAKAIRKKSGGLAHLDPTSPNYHAVRILWAG